MTPSTHALDPEDSRVQAARRAERDAYRHYRFDPNDHFIEIPDLGLQIRVVEVGTGPSVVLICGGHGPGAPWIPLLPELRDYTAYVMDRPGGGLSDGIDHRSLPLREIAARSTVGLFDHFELDAGGRFEESGDGSTQLAYVAQFGPDASSWAPVGDGLDERVRALSVSGEGVLYACGIFDEDGSETVTLNHVARFDGETEKWRPLGSGFPSEGPLPGPRAYAFGTDGALYTVGQFETSGDGSELLNRIARYDAAQEAWTNVGAVDVPIGLNGIVESLVAHEQNLYVGGGFTHVGNTRLNHVARLHTGTGEWQALAGGRTGVGNRAGRVYALAIGPGGTLYAGGDLLTARYDPLAKEWHELEDGTGRPSVEDRALAVGAGGILYAGGVSRGSSEQVLYSEAGTDDLKQLGSALTGGRGDVYALAVGPNGTLYAGGNFTGARASSASILNVARFNNDTGEWEPVGSGLVRDQGCYKCVDALAVGPEGTLYAGGAFEESGNGSTALNNVARFDVDAGEWKTLGSGLGPHGVRTLSIGPNGTLYAGGAFTQTGDGSKSLPRVARFDAEAGEWQAVGGAFLSGFRASQRRPVARFTRGEIFFSRGDSSPHTLRQWRRLRLRSWMSPPTVRRIYRRIRPFPGTPQRAQKPIACRSPRRQIFRLRTSTRLFRRRRDRSRDWPMKRPIPGAYEGAMELAPGPGVRRGSSKPSRPQRRNRPKPPSPIRAKPSSLKKREDFPYREASAQRRGPGRKGVRRPVSRPPSTRRPLMNGPSRGR